MLEQLVAVVSETYGEGRLLTATWHDGTSASGDVVVRLSSVLLSRVWDWSRLVDFLLDDGLVGLYFSDAESVEDNVGTQPECLLMDSTLPPLNEERRRATKRVVSAAERRKKRKAARKARQKSRRKR